MRTGKGPLVGCRTAKAVAGVLSQNIPRHELFARSLGEHVGRAIREEDDDAFIAGGPAEEPHLQMQGVSEEHRYPTSDDSA